MEDRPIDLVAEGYDVAIRLNPEPDAGLVGRCFARDQLLVVAAPSLTRPAGTSVTPDETDTRRSSGARCRTRRFGAGPPERAFSTRPVLQLPSLPMIRDAVLEGVGAAKLPRVLVADDLASGRLVSWGDASSRPAELWVLHASSRLASAKVKAFLRFLDGAFPDEWL